MYLSRETSDDKRNTVVATIMSIATTDKTRARV